MTLEEHVTNALRQHKSGYSIGRRETPVISFWPMRPKWEKWGNAWTCLGTDGDAMVENNEPIIPAVLRLVYFKINNGTICQLAYVVQEEYKGKQSVDEHAPFYERARVNMPEKLDV